MPTEFLADAQELAYGRYSGPPSNQQLEGYFHLDDADLELVKVRRGVTTRHGDPPKSDQGVGDARSVAKLPNDAQSLGVAGLGLIEITLGPRNPANVVQRPSHTGL